MAIAITAEHRQIVVLRSHRSLARQSHTRPERIDRVVFGTSVYCAC